MALMENLPNMLRGIFNDGLDEVLIFAFVFIFVLLTGRETDSPNWEGDNLGILPLLIIAVFLLLFATAGRADEDSIMEGETV